MEAQKSEITSTGRKLGRVKYPKREESAGNWKGNQPVECVPAKTPKNKKKARGREYNQRQGNWGGLNPIKLNAKAQQVERQATGSNLRRIKPEKRENSDLCETKNVIKRGKRTKKHRTSPEIPSKELKDPTSRSNEQSQPKTQSRKLRN